MNSLPKMSETGNTKRKAKLKALNLRLRFMPCGTLISKLKLRRILQTWLCHPMFPFSSPRCSAFICVVRTENVLQTHVSATLNPRLGIPFLEKDLVEKEHPDGIGRLPCKREGETAIDDCLALDVLEIAIEWVV